MSSNAKNRIGDVIDTAYGPLRFEEITGVNTSGNRLYTVKFLNTGYVKRNVLPRNAKGFCKDLLAKTVYGVACFGDGPYKAKIGGRLTAAYRTWVNVVERVYSPVRSTKNLAYADCKVSEEWLNFQVFAAWHKENYVEGWCLDKDLKYKGNRTYSADACMYVPTDLNNLLLDSKAIRGAHPIGVSFCKRNQKYQAALKVNSKQKFLGYYATPEEAHRAYCAAKNAEIDRKASEYPQFAQYLAKHKLLEEERSGEVERV